MNKSINQSFSYCAMNVFIGMTIVSDFQVAEQDRTNDPYVWMAAVEMTIARLMEKINCSVMVNVS